MSVADAGAVRSPFTAAVLAGGRATRMGADKALLEWRGRRLLDRQLDLLRGLEPAELLVSGRDGVDYAAAGVRVVIDAVADQGPMGGLAALLEAAIASRLLVLAVDLPAMSPTLLRRLLACCREGAGAVARTPAGWEPLVAVYPREILPLVRARLERRELAMHRMVEAAAAAGLVAAVEVTADELPGLANVNTPGDWAALP